MNNAQGPAGRYVESASTADTLYLLVFRCTHHDSQRRILCHNACTYGGSMTRTCLQVVPVTISHLKSISFFNLNIVYFCICINQYTWCVLRCLYELGSGDTEIIIGHGYQESVQEASQKMVRQPYIACMYACVSVYMSVCVYGSFLWLLHSIDHSRIGR